VTRQSFANQYLNLRGTMLQKVIFHTAETTLGDKSDLPQGIVAGMVDKQPVID
jgi:hypothetical protein